MRERLWMLFGLLLGVSFAVQVAIPVDLAEQPETSFETAPRGYAALFELFTGFDAVRGRWLSGVSMPPVDQTIWSIAADGICDDRRARSLASVGEDLDGNASDGQTAPGEGDAPFRFTIEPWLEAGGTAIVWLSHPHVMPEEAREEDPIPDVPPVETRRVTHRRFSAVPERSRGGYLDAGTDADVDAEPETPGDVDVLPDAESNEGDEAESIREDWRESIGSTRREYREGEPRRCDGIAGYPLPDRRLAGLEGGDVPEDADHAATAFSVGRWVESRADFDYDATRLLAGPTLGFFDPDSPFLEGWQPLWVEANDFSPFAIERPVGDGRLIVIADARVVSNARLGRLDAAPFAFDWVDAGGVPWIDEHFHGVVPESGTFRYLARSPAWAACLGLLVLGGLVIWRSHALPARRVDEVDPEAPTLASFVDSLARLYVGTADHARAFERYRALSLDRVRRALGLPLGTSSETVLASLRIRAENRPRLQERGVRDLLQEDLQIQGAAEFERAATRLDELVRLLSEENGPGAVARRAGT